MKKKKRSRSPLITTTQCFSICLNYDIMFYDLGIAPVKCAISKKNNLEYKLYDRSNVIRQCKIYSDQHKIEVDRARAILRAMDLRNGDINE